MKQAILTPFCGKPETTKHIDSNGDLSFIVKTRSLIPEAVFAAKMMAWIMAMFISLIGFAYVVGNEDVHGGYLVIVIYLGFILYECFFNLWKEILKQSKVFEITKDHFIVKHWPRDKIFDRKLDHKISLLPHRLTRWEEDQYELECKRKEKLGKVHERERLFTDSYHLSYEYLGQTNILLTIFSVGEAVCIASRLRACNDVLDAHYGIANGTPISPDQQWQDRSGDID